MCFEFDARPPDLPADLARPVIAGGAAAEMLELESEDGTRFGAALAQAHAAGEPSVIILPDVRGLYRFYVELAERFAAAGHHAIAIDYFGRTAGVQPRGEDFDFMAHLPQTSPELVQMDVAAARDALRERTGDGLFVTLGFCFGGAQSFLAGTSSSLGLDAVVGFYGTLDPSRIGFPFEMPTPLPHAAETVCPLLGLFGGDDPLIPAEDIEAFDQGLDAAGVEHELITYPGAPHSFFDRSFEQHAAASEDAWRRVLGFLKGLRSAASQAS
jgi:carboxymethylenebutenolidase